MEPSSPRTNPVIANAAFRKNPTHTTTLIPSGTHGAVAAPVHQVPRDAFDPGRRTKPALHNRARRVDTRREGIHRQLERIGIYGATDR